MTVNMAQPTEESNARKQAFEQRARQAHEAAVAELRERQLSPLNEGTYAGNYIELFREHFERLRGTS